MNHRSARTRVDADALRRTRESNIENSVVRTIDHASDRSFVRVSLKNRFGEALFFSTAGD